MGLQIIERIGRLIFRSMKASFTRLIKSLRSISSCRTRRNSRSDLRFQSRNRSFFKSRLRLGQRIISFQMRRSSCISFRMMRKSFTFLTYPEMNEISSNSLSTSTSKFHISTNQSFLLLEKSIYLEVAIQRTSIRNSVLFTRLTYKIRPFSHLSLC